MAQTSKQALRWQHYDLQRRRGSSRHSMYIGPGDATDNERLHTNLSATMS